MPQGNKEQTYEGSDGGPKTETNRHDGSEEVSTVVVTLGKGIQLCLDALKCLVALGIGPTSSLLVMVGYSVLLGRQ